MTGMQKVPGEDAPAAFPGLQLLGDDTAMGVCTDGVCAVPNPTTTAVPQKQD